jgi:hypothetical protein
MGSRLAIGSVVAVGGAISAVTVLNRLGAIELRDLAATPGSVADGREWLLLSSAFVADRPAIPSIAGFVLVGLAALVFCSGRVLWTAAAAGHLVATIAIYGVLDAASYTVSRFDYGTSAVIAAWIGVIASHLWRRGWRVGAFGLCAISAFVGWLCRPDLDILDTEHAVALTVGIAVAVWLPQLRAAPVHDLLVRSRPMLHGWLLRPGARRSG